MSSHNIPSKKPKPKIDSIKLTTEETNKINECKLLINTYSKTNYNKIKKIIGGFCVICADIPTKKISYDCDGALLVEYYCDKCFSKSGIDCS